MRLAWRGTLPRMLARIYLEVRTTTRFFICDTIALSVSFEVGCLVSVPFPAPPRTFEGLTAWTLFKQT